MNTGRAGQTASKGAMALVQVKYNKRAGQKHEKKLRKVPYRKKIESCRQPLWKRMNGGGEAA